MADEQALLGACDGDVRKPPFFVEFLGVAAIEPSVGKVSSSMPVSQTCSNSRPFAAWTVIMLTFGSSFMASVGETSDTRSR